MVYSRGGTPLLFAPEGSKAQALLFPSLYFMFAEMMGAPSTLQKDDEVLRIYLKPEVESFLFKGADLMWPGIYWMNRQEFKQYEVVQIYGRRQGAQLSQVK